ncbi:hypothetical protein C8R44DRAFT_975812 [Mycena epipterygia]|nr:hypothetical protein C8R44DRAFT_975812 [Mycena epipterygia]
MPGFPNIEDIVENIVDEVFLDETDEDGAYAYYESLPKNFLELALVSHSFLNPVRRNIYRDLTVEGPERFLLLTGQLRFSPHLAKFVKSATLRSACSEQTHIDGHDVAIPGMWQPRIVSCTALKWFLDACPQLTRLSLYGGDFVYALSAQSPKTVKFRDIYLCACTACDPQSPSRCMAELGQGLLKPIIAFPHLKQLGICEYAMDDGPTDVTVGVQSGSSVCTELNVASMLNLHTSPRSLTTLIRSMPGLKELVLDGLQPMAPGQLKQCLSFAAPTLMFLRFTDYHSEEGYPQPWENDTVAGLHQLTQLSLNGVPATAPFLFMLPPRLAHLRLAGATLAFLPVPVLVVWLRREPFPLRGVLKTLETAGELRAGYELQGPQASDAQVAELAQLCGALGIQWFHGPDF